VVLRWLLSRQGAGECETGGQHNRGGDYGFGVHNSSSVFDL
jgi:hypothetical protein